MKREKLFGYICTGLGGIIAIVGLVLFILSNMVNFRAVKVEAAIVSFYKVTTTEGEETTILDLTYQVDNNNIFTTYHFDDEFDDEQLTIEVYYDKNDPQTIIEAGWTFIPLYAFLIGLLMTAFGMYISDITKFGLDFEGRGMTAKQRKARKKLLETQKKVFSMLFPLISGIVFLLFGLIWAISDYRWWNWVFIVGGTAEIVYVLLDLVPMLVNLRRLNLTKKYKVQVQEIAGIDNTIENAEGKREKSEKELEADLERDLRAIEQKAKKDSQKANTKKRKES